MSATALSADIVVQSTTVGHSEEDFTMDQALQQHSDVEMLAEEDDDDDMLLDEDAQLIQHNMTTLAQQEAMPSPPESMVQDEEEPQDVEFEEVIENAPEDEQLLDADVATPMPVTEPVVETEYTVADPAESEPTESEVAEPEHTEPGHTEPGHTEPEHTEPEHTELENAELEASIPESAATVEPEPELGIEATLSEDNAPELEAEIIEPLVEEPVANEAVKAAAKVVAAEEVELESVRVNVVEPSEAEGAHNNESEANTGEEIANGEAILEGGLAQDGTESGELEVRSIRTDFPNICVILRKDENNYLLCPSDATNDTVNELAPETILEDDSVLCQSIDNVFEVLRGVFSDGVDSACELFFELPQLKISVSEDNIYSRDATVYDFVQIYYSLCVENDGNAQPDPLIICLGSQSRFISRFNHIAELIKEGYGMSHLQALDSKAGDEISGTTADVSEAGDELNGLNGDQSELDELGAVPGENEDGVEVRDTDLREADGAIAEAGTKTEVEETSHGKRSHEAMDSDEEVAEDFKRVKSAELE